MTITPKQASFARTLLAERVHTYGDDADLDTLTRAQASELIEELLTMPRKPETATLVPAGRYAIADNNGEVRFVKVERPGPNSRWSGWTFVSLQAGDDFYPVRNRDNRASILHAIALDPREAMLRYGREIGACGHCGRTLTDAESRAAGIGPVCAGKVSFG